MASFRSRWSARPGARGTADKAGQPILTKEPQLLLNDNDAGKPEGIHLMIGRRPRAAFGNSVGDQQMLEYTTIDAGGSLGDADPARRRRARIRVRPGEGLPDTKVGTFTQALYDDAKRGLDRGQHEERLGADLPVCLTPHMSTAA